VITGASSGIGTALAHEFASHGHELLLVARREQALKDVADAIAAKGASRPTVLRLDVSRVDAVRDLSEALEQRALEPEILVNNAGFGLFGRADRLDRMAQLAMIDVNVRALTDLSLAFLESIERRRGGILNVSSIAAFLPGPRMAVYYASKAYVLSFSEALHHELKPRGVRVTALCPGPVLTEFQMRAGMNISNVPKFALVSPELAAKEAYRGLKQGQRIVIPGAVSKVVPWVVRLMPQSAALKLLAARQPTAIG
jgi:short-subunit dehydrogenase